MPRSIPLKTLFACTMLFAAALPARAQSTPGTPEPAEQRINEAFATPYADAMIRTFVKSVRRSVDSACLEQKAFDDAAIAARGRALLQRYGTQMLKLINDGVDHEAHKKIFTENAGPRAVSEFDQLKREAEVKKLIAISAPSDLARTVTVVAENFDHYRSAASSSIRFRRPPAARKSRRRIQPKRRTPRCRNSSRRQFRRKRSTATSILPKPARKQGARPSGARSHRSSDRCSILPAPTRT